MTLELISKILETCIVPLIGILSIYVIQFVKKRSEALQKQIDNDILNKYINLAENAIINCVDATNQTMVDLLKSDDKFNKDAQNVAFKKTYDSVMALLTEDAKRAIIMAYGDLNTYVTNAIEAQVRASKE